MDTLPCRISVLGMGTSGLAVARYLLDHRDEGHDLELSVYDAGVSARLENSAATLDARGARVYLGANHVDASDLCIASPGIPPSSPLRRSASKNCTQVISEIEFAYSRSVSPWLAITGTNGKTTVTSLVAHLLGEGAVPAECVGNIGDPAVEVVDAAGPSTAIVAEVSSFQLALTERFHPRVSILLNITPDHLDWHGSIEVYAADKARVFRNQGVGDTAVIDVDDPGAAPYAESVAAQGVRVVRVSRQTLHPGGAGVRDGILTVDTPSGWVELLPASELKIRGGHNVTNALAAAAAAAAWGIAPAAIARALANFEPIAHRLQPVGIVGEVEYVNDSKATNPGAVLVALDAFRDRGVILLLGGRNKGSSFDEVAALAADICRVVVAFGEAREEISAACIRAGVDSLAASGLEEAVGLAQVSSRPGDVVLLSPGCASFDEFEGYAHRGRAFGELVNRMAGDPA